MTLAQMKTLLGQLLAADLDNFAGDSPSGAELTAQLNYAIRAVGRLLFLVRKQTKALTTGTYTVDLDALTMPVVMVMRAQWEGVDLLDYRDKPGLMSMVEIEAVGDDFVSGGTAGTPVRGCQLDTTLYINPKPDSGGDVMILGQCLPASLVDGTDDNNSPDLPTWVHEAVVLLAATFAADPQVTEEEGLARLARFEKRMVEAIQAEGERNRQIWAATSGARQSGAVIQ